MSTKLKLNINEYKKLLYGIHINIENINNIEDIIHKIIDYNEPCQYLKEHPFYGCSEINNYKYFEKLIEQLKVDNFI